MSEGPPASASRLTRSAQAALREILQPSPVALPRLSGSAVVDAVVAAALASGISIADELGDDVARDCPTDVGDVARRLGVPARRVRLDGTWWQGDTGAFIVSAADDAVFAAIPDPGGYVLVADGRARRIDAALSAGLGEFAFSISSRLEAEPASVRDLLAIALRPSSKREMAAILAAAVAVAILGAGVPVISGLVVGELVPAGAGMRILAMGLLLVIVALGATGLGLVQSLLVQRISMRLDAISSDAILDRLLRLPMTFFARHQAGDLAARVQGTDRLTAIAIAGGMPVISGVILTGSGLAVMFGISVWLALQVAGVLLVASLVVAVIIRRQMVTNERYMQASLALAGPTLAMVSGVSKIRVAAAAPRMHALWALGYARQQQRARDQIAVAGWLSMAATVIPTLVTITVVLQSLDSSRDLPLGRFTAFIAAAVLASGSLAGLIAPISMMTGVVPLLDALRPILAEVPEQEGFTGADVVLTGRISVVGVDFAYPGPGPNVLRQVSLEIQPGQFVAVVGPSGSGKSTLLSVLIGLQTPCAGQVLYDGRSLPELGVECVRRQLGVVIQSARLSTGTLLDNIVGTSGLTSAHAWAAAEAAGIANDIRAMPMGMATMVSDGASSFSGGQIQRIGLARALARKPAILILDEATSSLDARAQAHIGGSLRELGATRIVVAHRIRSVRDADLIIVLDAGTVVESGTFDELIAQGGLFASMASGQQTTRA